MFYVILLRPFSCVRIYTIMLASAGSFQVVEGWIHWSQEVCPKDNALSEKPLKIEGFHVLGKHLAPELPSLNFL